MNTINLTDKELKTLRAFVQQVDAMGHDELVEFFNDDKARARSMIGAVRKIYIAFDSMRDKQQRKENQ